MDLLSNRFHGNTAKQQPCERECRGKRSAVRNIFWHIMQFSWGKGQSHQQLSLPHGVAVQLTASGSPRDAGRKSEQSVISLLSPQDTTTVLAHGQSGRQIGAAEPTSFLPRGCGVEWKLKGERWCAGRNNFPLVFFQSVFFFFFSKAQHFFFLRCLVLYFARTCTISNKILHCFLVRMEAECCIQVTLVTKSKESARSVRDMKERGLRTGSPYQAR